MTDNEIIKALECCGSDKADCKECTLRDAAFVGECIPQTAKEALDLINRQKARIERLEKLADYQTKDVKEWKQKYEEAVKNLLDLADTATNETKQARTEAIKEFAERLKNMLTACSYTLDGEREYLVRDYDIDNLVKEMVGEQE